MREPVHPKSFLWNAVGHQVDLILAEVPVGQTLKEHGQESPVSPTMLILSLQKGKEHDPNSERHER